jgi:nitrogen regulatory protein PII
MYMVMFVLDDPNQLDEILDAWDAAGVSGVTIIESTGINRRRRARQVGTGFMSGMNRIIGDTQESHYTLYVIVPDESQVQACIQAAEEVVGDFNKPNTGVLAAWPLFTVRGVPLARKRD